MSANSWEAGDTEAFYVRWRGQVWGPLSLAALKHQLNLEKLSIYHEVSTDKTHWKPLEALLEQSSRQERHVENLNTVTEVAAGPGRAIGRNITNENRQNHSYLQCSGAQPDFSESAWAFHESFSAQEHAPQTSRVLLAFFLDVCCCVASALLLLGLALGLSAYSWHTLGLLQIFAIGSAWLYLWWLYFSAAQATTAASTFGQRLYGIRVLDAKSRPLSIGQSTSRFFLALISLVALIGPAYWLLNSKKESLHDRVMKSRLVG